MQTPEPEIVNGRTRVIGELSAESRWCAELFRKLQPGETASYEEIAAKVGLSIESLRNERRHIIASAIRQVRNQDGVVMRCVATIGYKRLTAVEIPKVQDSRVQHIRRQSLVAVKELTSPDCDGLEGDALHERNFRLSGFGVLAHMTKPKIVRRLEEAVRAGNARLDAGQVLRLFAAPRPQAETVQPVNTK
jgi:hypothetical protein